MKNALALTALITALGVVAVPALAGDHEKKKRHDQYQDRQQDRHQDSHQYKKQHKGAGYHKDFRKYFGHNYRHLRPT